MWGIIPAAGNGTRIQPLAFSKELLPVGSRFEGGTERPRAVSEYLIERMLQRRRRQDLFCDLALEIRHPAILWRAAAWTGGRDRLCGAARAARAVRRDLSRRAVHRSGRAGAGRAARHDLAAGGRLRAAARRPARLSDLPGRAAGIVRRRGQRPRGRVREIQVKREGAASNWVWGAFRMPGAVLHELHRLWRARDEADEYIGTLVNAWLAEGGEAVAVPAGTRLCRCRHAGRLSRGDAAPGRGGAVAGRVASRRCRSRAGRR